MTRSYKLFTKGRGRRNVHTVYRRESGTDRKHRRKGLEDGEYALFSRKVQTQIMFAVYQGGLGMEHMNSLWKGAVGDRAWARFTKWDGSGTWAFMTKGGWRRNGYASKQRVLEKELTPNSLEGMGEKVSILFPKGVSGMEPTCCFPKQIRQGM